jgi:hypothetical protein
MFKGLKLVDVELSVVFFINTDVWNTAGIIREKENCVQMRDTQLHVIVLYRRSVLMKR